MLFDRNVGCAFPRSELGSGSGPEFCKNFPVKKARQGHIILDYQFITYGKNSPKIHKEISDAKESLFTALQNLDSEESKEITARFDEAREKGMNKYHSSYGSSRALFDIPLQEVAESITEGTTIADKGFVKAKELAEQVKELESFKKGAEREIEAGSEGETHIEAMYYVGELATKEIINKSKEAEDNFNLLQVANKNLEKVQETTEQKDRQMEEKDNQLERVMSKSEKQDRRIELLENKIGLFEKPLPPLPKK